MTKTTPHDDHAHGAHDAPSSAASAVSLRREKRLRFALALNLVIVVIQVAFGVAAHSLGLLADAGHNLTDVAAVGASLLAVRWARRRPTDERSFGYHRATILAAQANAASILAVTVLIVYEGIRRLLHPESVSGGLVVIVAAGAAIANLLALVALREGHDHSTGGHEEGEGDLNMRSAVLHMAGDAIASLGVAVAGAVILITGRFDRLDPAASIGIGLLIAYQAWKLLRSSADVLLESTPSGLDLTKLTDVMAKVDGVEGVHDLHVWSLSSEVRALSAHVVVSGSSTLEQAQVVGDAVKAAITVPFRISHTTLELECEGPSHGDDWCAMDDTDGPAPWVAPQ